MNNLWATWSTKFSINNFRKIKTRTIVSFGLSRRQTQTTQTILSNRATGAKRGKNATRGKRGKIHSSQITVGLSSDWLHKQRTCPDWLGKTLKLDWMRMWINHSYFHFTFQAWDKEKVLFLDRNRSQDIPNTGPLQCLGRRGFDSLMRTQIFSLFHARAIHLPHLV